MGKIQDKRRHTVWDLEWPVEIFDKDAQDTMEKSLRVLAKRYLFDAVITSEGKQLVRACLVLYTRVTKSQLHGHLVKSSPILVTATLVPAQERVAVTKFFECSLPVSHASIAGPWSQRSVSQFITQAPLRPFQKLIIAKNKLAATQFLVCIHDPTGKSGLTYLARRMAGGNSTVQLTWDKERDAVNRAVAVGAVTGVTNFVLDDAPPSAFEMFLDLHYTWPTLRFYLFTHTSPPTGPNSHHWAVEKVLSDHTLTTV